MLRGTNCINRVALAENRLPRLVEGIDLKALPLGPADAFVLSCIDGISTEADIASASGIGLDHVQATISRLIGLGVLIVAAAPEQVKRAPRPRSNSNSGQFAMGAVSEWVVRIEHPGAALYDERELEEAVDIEPARKRRILDMYYRLDALNNYEILGVPTSADRRAIKAAYHEIINVVHPDRYYGKNLGSFKSKLERLFQRVTDAQDTLTRADARADYDAYLNAGKSTQDLERQLNDEEAYARELDAVRARIEAEAQRAANTPVPGHVSSAPPVAETPRAPQTPTPPVLPASAPPGRPPPSKADADARRRALARKLGFSSPPPAEARASAPPATIDPTSARERATLDLKRRYELRMLDARRRQAQEYVTRAEASVADKRLVEAVNALRIAVSLIPDDPVLRQRLEDLQAEASRELADRYLEQAEYEEREHHFTEAARSYARAIAGKATPRMHERLAFCLLSAQGDVKQAVEHARKAVILTPNDVKFRVTLARAYIAAGMKESAIGELERASALAPTDDTLKEHLRRARRGEF